jgi:4-hydroxybenzoyl-CoA reductase subunit beta
MQRIEPFELLRPRTAAEAAQLLADRERAMVVAGGSDLVPKLKRGQFAPAALVSLADVGSIEGVSREGDVVRIGALTRLRALERAREIADLTALREAVGVVATPIIRNMATVGGNMLQDTRCRYYDRSPFWRDAVGSCLKLDTDICRVATSGGRCFATLCSDLAPALVALDAKVSLVGTGGTGTRVVPLEALYRDDGKDPFDLRGEILARVDVPARARFSRYRKLRIRDSFDFPELGVAVVIEPAGDEKLSVCVAVTAVSPGIPVFRNEVKRGDLHGIASAVYAALKPMDTLFFPPAYRKTVARNFLLGIFDEFLVAG